MNVCFTILPLRRGVQSVDSCVRGGGRGGDGGRGGRHVVGAEGMVVVREQGAVHSISWTSYAKCGYLHCDAHQLPQIQSPSRGVNSLEIVLYR